jgi:hypothetical protein
MCSGDAVPAEYSRDEALGVPARMPACVAMPASTGEVAGKRAFDPQGILNPGVLLGTPGPGDG